ncbi:MAG: hypothetical protein ACMG6E_03725, partial [Candidatus Roizmanbacteria bacterium]
MEDKRYSISDPCDDHRKGALKREEALRTIKLKHDFIASGPRLIRIPARITADNRIRQLFPNYPTHTSLKNVARLSHLTPSTRYFIGTQDCFIYVIDRIENGSYDKLNIKRCRLEDEHIDNLAAGDYEYDDNSVMVLVEFAVEVATMAARLGTLHDDDRFDRGVLRAGGRL